MKEKKKLLRNCFTCLAVLAKFPEILKQMVDLEFDTVVLPSFEDVKDEVCRKFKDEIVRLMHEATGG